MLRKTIAYFLILMLMCYALAISALEQLALTNSTSNDNYWANTYDCQAYYGGTRGSDAFSAGRPPLDMFPQVTSM